TAGGAGGGGGDGAGGAIGAIGVRTGRRVGVIGRNQENPSRCAAGGIVTLGTTGTGSRCHDWGAAGSAAGAATGAGGSSTGHGMFRWVNSAGGMTSRAVVPPP